MRTVTDAYLLASFFRAPRTGNGQNRDGRRGVRGLIAAATACPISNNQSYEIT